MDIRVLGYSPEDGWNLRGMFGSITDALHAASAEVGTFRYMAVVEVRPHEPRVVIVRTNARHLTRLMRAANFRRAALAL